MKEPYTIEQIEAMHTKYLQARWWFMANVMEQFAETMRENARLNKNEKGCVDAD